MNETLFLDEKIPHIANTREMCVAWILGQAEQPIVSGLLYEHRS